MERAELEQWKGREVARLLALVESERRYYQEIVAAIPVGLLVLSHDFSIVSSNRAIRRIFGFRSGDPVRGRLDTLLPAWVLDKIQSVFKGCEAIYDLMVEHEGRRLRVSALPIRNGDEDHPYEALVSIEDLTSASAPEPAAAPAPEAPPAPAVVEAPVLEIAPEAVAPAAEPTPAPATAEAVELLQNLNAIIWAVDLPEMNFLFVTNTAEEVLGYHPDHWLNTPGFWTDRIEPADREATLKSYADAIEHGHRHSCEFRATTAAGRTVWLRETARILPGADGRPKHLIGLTIDITERRQLEEANIRSERTQAMSKLASRLSHDLNNMLMIVKGYGEELLNNASDAIRTDVQEILYATQRMDTLTSQLLGFTRRQPAAAESVDVSEILSGLERSLRFAAGPKVTIELRTDPGLQAKANRAQLEQLLSGLATRASEAMHASGTLTIAIGETDINENLQRFERVLAPGAYVAINVEDNDGLMTHDAQMALFESFLPVKELPGETGAILSRSYEFVRHWGGDIFVASTESGTRISILLPHAGRKPVVETPEAEAPAAVEPQVAAVPAPAALETIMVVEDEGGIRALVRKILKRQGYTVLEAANGEEALKICQEHTGKIDLVITDVVMPEIGGRELVENLKERCGDMKVLYVSGYTDDAAIYSGELPPGTAFLQKPFTLGSLLDKVKDVLGR
jgi:two-component system cell cycle sensor histidine kinase/response regulator CckA